MFAYKIFINLRDIILKIACLFPVISRIHKLPMTHKKYLCICILDYISLFFFICNSTRLDDDDKLSLFSHYTPIKERREKKKKEEKVYADYNTIDLP